MLTYTPPKSNPSIKLREKPWILLLLVFAWLWPGVFSHGLWNPAEPSTYAAIEAFNQGSNFWLPSVFGKPDFHISPMYLWVAAGFQRLLYPWAADAYSASRFASVFFTTIGLTHCGMAGFRFLGRHQGRSVVLILIGCMGLIQLAHFLGGLSLQFAALSMVLYGFALVQTRVIMAALLMGIGWALLSVSTAGFTLPIALMAVSLSLLASTQWRFKRYYITLVGAFCIALPLMAIYPFALWRSAPAAFSMWANQYLFGTFGGLQHFQIAFSLPYYLRNLIWFAFPAWPLAMWTYSRMTLSQYRWGVLAIAWLTIIGLLLSLDPHRFQDNLIWLMPPLALVAAAQLDGLRRGAAAFLNWFGIMTFGLFAAFLWLGFFAMNYGWPKDLADRSHHFSPYYTPDIHIMPMIVAICFTPLWLRAITRKHIRGRQAITNWAAGITLTWALMMTLFLPWFDAAKSTEPVVQNMQQAMPEHWQQAIRSGQTCISVGEHDVRTRIAFGQYSTLPLTINGDCAYHLTQHPINQAAPIGWQIIWQGSRPRNDVGFALLQRQANIHQH